MGLILFLMMSLCFIQLKTLWRECLVLEYDFQFDNGVWVLNGIALKKLQLLHRSGVGLLVLLEFIDGARMEGSVKRVVWLSARLSGESDIRRFSSYFVG